jgi:hypothetical protein
VADEVFVNEKDRQVRSRGAMLSNGWAFLGCDFILVRRIGLFWGDADRYDRLRCALDRQSRMSLER